MQTHFGLVMRQLRLQAGYSVDQLAREIGAENPRVIERVESGISEIHGRLLIPWANAVRLEPEMLAYLWMNMKLRKMFDESGINARFKVVPDKGDLDDNTGSFQTVHGQGSGLAQYPKASGPR